MSSSSARSTRAPGRSPPIRGRGSTGRCGRRWACRRRKSASARRRTPSSRCSAPSASISRARPRSTACRRCRRAGCCACRRCWRGWARRQPRGEPWLAWAQARNRIDGPPTPVRAPEPRPPLALRPRQLSVTTIEKWIANPYAIFAERILGLEALPVLGREPDAALRGQIVHEALGRFALALSRSAAEGCAGRADGVCRDCAGGLHRLAAGGRVLGAALCALRRLVRRDRAGAPSRHRAVRMPRWKAPWCWRGRRAPSR